MTKEWTEKDELAYSLGDMHGEMKEQRPKPHKHQEAIDLIEKEIVEEERYDARGVAITSAWHDGILVGLRRAINILKEK